MRYGKVPGVGKPISRLVQGTGTVMLNSKDLDRSFRLLDEVFALGCNAFDTALLYEEGDTERTVGRWVRKHDIRDEIVIIGKGAHSYPGHNRVTPADITADILDSLEQFKFDYIDLYLLHRDDPSVPVGPIVEVLNEHLKAGRIHSFGGSNWTHTRIQEANAYAEKHGLTPFVASSANFSLAERVKEPWVGCVSIGGHKGEAARAWYANAKLALFAWSSLGGGFFSGRFTRDNLNSFQDYFDKVCVESYCYEDNFKRLDHVRELAQQKELTIPQIAMAYVMNQPMNIFALVGCRNGDEFEASANALEVKLSPEEIAWLDLGDKISTAY